jgi:cold shock CspA family protein
VQERPHEFFNKTDGFTILPDKQPEPAEEFVSTILNVKDGYGFIKDDVRNNIFFHWSTLINYDFSDLKAGMEVRYSIEKDEERSKQHEIPCYRATRVTLLE